MKIKLIREYIKEGDKSDLAFLKECELDGDDQGIDEFFNTGWDLPFNQQIEVMEDKT